MNLQTNSLVMSRQEALNLIVLLTQAVQKEMTVGYGAFLTPMIETIFIDRKPHNKPSCLCVTVQNEKD